MSFNPPYSQGLALSISDDDICSECSHLKYRPGEQSICKIAAERGSWPAKFDKNGYTIKCIDLTPA